MFDSTHQKKLTQILESEAYPESLNFIEAHGFLCALNAGPDEVVIEEKIKLILNFEGETSPTDEKSLIELISLLDKSIANSLFSGEPIELPCSLELDESGKPGLDLSDWLLGFFEAHLESEDHWYQKDETLVAEMLLPFIVCFFELEDEDLKALRSDTNLLQNLAMQIPQASLDLYLFFNID